MTVLLYKGCSAWTASNKNAQATWRSRLVGRGRATGNRVTVKSGSRVRISSSPPPKGNPARPVGLLFSYARNRVLHEFASIRKAKMRSIAGLLTMAGDLRIKEMFIAKQRLTSSSPLQASCTHPNEKLECVYFFSNEYFGMIIRR